MFFPLTVPSLLTGDSLRPAMGNVISCREIRPRHWENTRPQRRLTCLFLLLLCFTSLSVIISENILVHSFSPLCKHRLFESCTCTHSSCLSPMCGLTPQLLPPLLTVMPFHLLCVSVVLNNMRVFAFCRLRQISPHTVTRGGTSLAPDIHSAVWKFKWNMDILQLFISHQACLCPTLSVLSCLPSWLGLLADLKRTPSPRLSLLCHLFAPVKLPQFLSVQCRSAHFLIERCSEVQECRGAQCTSVFGLAQKCFSWLNPLVLRSSYNKLKGPNCPQGKGLATIDMWWDKSPVLIRGNPSPQIGGMNTSAVSVLLCGQRDRRFDAVKHYIYSI